MALIQVIEGRHLTADEFVNGRLVRKGQVFLTGEDMPVQETEAVELRKDTKKFKDKGKA